MDRAEAIEEVIRDVLARRCAGEAVGDADVLARHAELCPELDQELSKLRHIDQARNAIPPTPHPSAPAEPSAPEDQRPTPALPPIEHLGDFEILREIGRGGMGVVYRSRQISLNRLVALKILSGGLGLTPKAVLRFQREAEAAAKLHHTNIVPVYASGEANGTHFYAMELVEGPSLDQFIRQLRQAKQGWPDAPGLKKDGDLAATGPYVNNPSAPTSGALTSSSLSSDSHYFDTVARMIAEVADALEYAHQHGVIHRDIKPSNLLLSPDGHLSVNDFGLARLLEQPGMTLTGEFVGTPRYMSPEQIAAGRTPLDHRTDIYSLGATLYELLTLQPPFTGERRDQVLAQILHKEPKAPRKLNKRVPGDLETICLKSIDKDPDRRYQTAAEMAEDLRRYVNRFAIVARRTGPIQRTIKWIRRRPAIAATLAGAAILLCVAILSAYQTHVSNKARIAEKQQHEQELLVEHQQNALDKALLVAMSGDLDEAEKAILEAERLGASTGQVRMTRGQLALHRGQLEEALRHLKQAVELLPESVAAHAMLAQVSLAVVSWEESARLLREVEKLEPKTDMDYLFKGLAHSGMDPQQGLAIIDEAVLRRPSVLAHVIRAEARGYRAEDTADPRDTELAIEEAQAAKTLLPGNPVALRVSLINNLVAAGTHEQTGENEKRRGALVQAKTDAVALGRFAGLPDALLARWRYLKYVGQDDRAAFDQLKRLAETTEHAELKQVFVSALYRRGECEKALAFVERNPSGYAGALRPILLAEAPAGRARAVEAQRELAVQHQEGSSPLYDQIMLRVLGCKEEALANSLQYRNRGDHLPRLRHADWQHLLDYNCGFLTEAELLNATGRSKHAQCRAHYFIAFARLGDGDRAGAREHFAKAVATRVLSKLAYENSEMFLARMNQDPSWPPWIPLKK